MPAKEILGFVRCWSDPLNALSDLATVARSTSPRSPWAMTSDSNPSGPLDLLQRECGLKVTEGQRAVDFVVFDDVGPVFDDPVSAGLLVVEEVSKVFGGVVEGELSGLQFGDEVSAVGRGGGEDVVELVESLFELVDRAVGDGDRLVSVAVGEPGSGVAQRLRQLGIWEGARGGVG